MAYRRTRSNKGSHWGNHKYDSISKNHKDYIKEYRVWRNMIQRCHNPNCDMYPYYGGRGIKVCDRWLDKNTGFINFYNDMGKRPTGSDSKAYQIDRIDNEGDYTPENCRWVSAAKNARNRSTNIFVHIYGEPYCITDACRMFGVKRTTVTENIRLRGKTPVDALADELEKACLLTKTERMI